MSQETQSQKPPVRSIVVSEAVAADIETIVLKLSPEAIKLLAEKSRKPGIEKKLFQFKNLI